MSFIGDLFDSSKGAGFQAKGLQGSGFTDQSQQLREQIQNASNAQGDIQGAQRNLIGQQQGLVGQLQDIAAGRGPNPAQAQLQAATNQGIKEAAGTISSAKGLNPALAARLGGQQASNSLQTAANQAANLQANQSINAQNQIANVYGQIGNTYGQMSGADLAQLQNSQGALSAQNAQIAGNVGSQNTANAGIAGQNMQAQSNFLGNIMNSVGSGAMLLAKGGDVPEKAPEVAPVDSQPAAPQSFLNKFFSSMTPTKAPTASASAGAIGAPIGTLLGLGLGAAAKGIGAGVGAAYQGINSLFSPSTPAAPQGVAPVPAAESQNPIADKAMNDVLGSSMLLKAKGGKIPKRNIADAKPLYGEMLASKGKRVPGKASVKGDSYKNDTVPAMLSPGEIVIPRSVATSEDAPKKAAKFVAAVLAKKGMR